MERETIKNAAQEALLQHAAVERIKIHLAGQHPSYHITTLGCQINAHDSEKLAGILAEAGYIPSEREEDADLVVYNT